MHRKQSGLVRLVVPSLSLLVVLLAASRLPSPILAETAPSVAEAGSVVSLSDFSLSSLVPLLAPVTSAPYPRTIAGSANVVPTVVPTATPTPIPKVDVKALQRTLDAQLASRGGTGSVAAYATRAKMLIGLQVKLAALKKTPAGQGVDFTAYANRLSSLLSRIPTLHPIHGTYAGYGWRTHPITGVYEFHAADDVGAPTGTAIKAAAGGTVTCAAYDSSGGNMIVIDHGNGFKSVYMHCSKLKVKTGQKVAKAQVIGTVGSTGSSTTPHLHFAISYQGTSFNPVKILQQW